MVVTNETLGKLLLKETFTIVTQTYLNYYIKGPTSANTYGGYHPGIDYRALTPLKVYSPIAGTVKSLGSGRVSINITGTNVYFIFLHLSKFFVKSGESVQVGDEIGLTGSVGTKDPHLHVEAKKGSFLASWYLKNSNQTGFNVNPVSVVSVT